MFQIWLVALGLAFARHASATPSTVVACAIRWDAWYTNGEHDPAHYTANTLGKPEWRSRVPLHAVFDDAGHITWAPTQATFDAEIRAAHDAHLCWAYLTYGKDHKIDLGNSMMRGLAFQRTSALREEVPYALILQADTIGKGSDYKGAVDGIVMLMHDKNYQHVTIGNGHKPLLFFFYDATDVASNFGTSPESLKAPFDLIRKRSIEQGLGEPYIVILASPAAKAEAIRATIGGDAVSEYIAGRRNGHPMQWEQFEPTVEAEWDQYAAATSADVVPTLRSGADIRARCQTPPAFDHRFPPGDKCDNYTVNPTNDQLRTEFRDAVRWLDVHPRKTPADLMLVYSWSECDESGNCLMPTLGDPKGAKLNAIGQVLR